MLTRGATVLVGCGMPKADTERDVNVAPIGVQKKDTMPSHWNAEIFFASDPR